MVTLEELRENAWLNDMYETLRLIESCNSLEEFMEKIDNSSLAYFICEGYNEFADMCTKWDEFDNHDWRNILIDQPQFADKCNKWDDFDVYTWRNLLPYAPQFADKCNKWDDFDEFAWNQILEKQPQLRCYKK